MCGIVGLVSKKDNGFYGGNLDVFQDMLVADSVRGADSTGCFAVNRKNTVRIIKSATVPHYMFDTKNWQNFRDSAIQKATMLVGHNRKATVGKVSTDTAHPFYESNIILVHNGTINNQKDLQEGVEVDSHAICHSIANRGYKETIKEIDGAFVLVWFDVLTKTLNIVRNDKRPLCYVETDDFFWFASEAAMLAWILIRNNQKPLRSMEELAPEKLLKLTTGPYSLEIEGVEVRKEVSSFHQTTAVTTVSSPKWDRDDGEEEVVVTDLKEYYQQYKIGEAVIFVPESFRRLAHQERFGIFGKAYLPGNRVFSKAAIFLPAGVTEEEAADFATQKKLLANLQSIMVTPNNTIHAVFNNPRGDIEISTWADEDLLNHEWEHICTTMHCAKCEGSINEEFAPITSVQCTREFTNWKVTCDACVGKRVSEMSKEKQDAYFTACAAAI